MRGLAVVVSLAVGLQAQSAPSTPHTGVIAGNVVDAGTGRPISGVIVSISGGTLPPRLTPGDAVRILTGADGRFVFPNLSPGNFTVSATRAGYGSGSAPRVAMVSVVQPVTLAVNERKTDVAVRMWKNGAIAGTVTDEAGEPLVGVQVRALARSFAGGRRRFSFGTLGSNNVFTDDRGIYRLADMAPGEYMIVASAPQVAVPMPVMTESAPGMVRPRSIFDIGGPFTLPGTAGSIQIGNAAYRLGRGAPTPPPPSGGRVFVYPPTFHPAAVNAAEATTVTIASGEERLGIDLQLQPVPTGRISGTLIGPDGPASLVAVRLVPAGSDEVSLGDNIPAGLTDRDGAFIFPAVPAGQYTLRAYLGPSTAPATVVPEGLFTHMPIAATASDIDGVVAIFQPGGRISGRFEFEGIAERPSPARMTQVALLVEPFDPGQSSASFPRPDSSGHFKSDGHPPGKYFVRVTGSPNGWMFKSATLDGQDVTDVPLELRRDDVTGLVLTFTDRWSGLGGVVRNARNAPDPGAIVLVFPTDASAWSNFGSAPRRLRAARANAKGEFGVTSLPPGDYYAVAVPQDHSAEWREPKTLEALSRIATRITIAEGEHKTQDFTTREVRQ
jgi:hypothetical protein